MSTNRTVYRNPLPNTSGGNSNANLFRCLRSLLSVGQRSDTAPRKRWECPICSESYPCREERDRHELAHVPYFMHCPLPHCAWRGNRADLFKKHWQQEDHRAYHKTYGYSPKKKQIQTYDPWNILNQIKDGLLGIHEGEAQALFLVQVKAGALKKTKIWMDQFVCTGGGRQASSL